MKPHRNMYTLGKGNYSTPVEESVVVSFASHREQEGGRILSSTLVLRPFHFVMGAECNPESGIDVVRKISSQ